MADVLQKWSTTRSNQTTIADFFKMVGMPNGHFLGHKQIEKKQYNGLFKGKKHTEKKQ